MQAIVTKYLPATDHRGSRIVAECASKRLVIPYSHSGKEHEEAARELCAVMGWTKGELIEGGLPNGNRVFVFANSPRIPL